MTESQTIETGYEMLENHRFDVLMASYFDGERDRARRPALALERWPYAWASEPVFLMLHKRNAGLIPRLDAVLQEMQREGVIDAQYEAALRSLGLQPLPNDK